MLDLFVQYPITSLIIVLVLYSILTGSWRYSLRGLGKLMRMAIGFEMTESDIKLARETKAMRIAFAKAWDEHQKEESKKCSGGWLKWLLLITLI